MTSRLQFARPAVDESLLLQITRIPPVASAIDATCPLVIVRSISARNAMASSCFLSSNSLRCSIIFLSVFAQLLNGLLWGNSGCDGCSSSSTEGSRILREDSTIFLGEYCSFHSLRISWLQNASILGRWGGAGIRCRLEGDFNFGVDGLDGGVRVGWLPSSSYGGVSLGGMLRYI